MTLAEWSRGLLCVALFPLHTLVLGTLAILTWLVVPSGNAIIGVGRLWSWIILATASVQVRTAHAERAAIAPCVIVSNHQSLFDIPALLQALPRQFRIVAKRELFWIPFFGWALFLGGFIPLHRSDRERAVASLARAAQRVRRGTTVVVFAEGTRSRDGRLQRIKKGALHLAQQARVSLVPVTLSGSRAVLPRGSWFPRPGTIDVVVGRPLPPIPPGAPVEEDLVRAVAAALEAGYTDHHVADLDPGTGGSCAEATSGPKTTV